MRLIIHFSFPHIIQGKWPSLFYFVIQGIRQEKNSHLFRTDATIRARLQAKPGSIPGHRTCEFTGCPSNSQFVLVSSPFTHCPDTCHKGQVAGQNLQSVSECKGLKLYSEHSIFRVHIRQLVNEASLPTPAARVLATRIGDWSPCGWIHLSDIWGTGKGGWRILNSRSVWAT